MSTTDRPEPETPDLEGGLVAIFPLVNGSSVDMAVGILLKYTREFDALHSVPDITIVAADDIHFDNAAYWINEISIHTMSDDDISAYSQFVDDSNGDGKYWKALVEGYLRPEHERVFRDLGLYMRSRKDCKFKRLPVEHMTNLNETALYEFQGWIKTPDRMLPTEHLGNQTKIPSPARAAADPEPAGDRNAEAESATPLQHAPASTRPERPQGLDQQDLDSAPGLESQPYDKSVPREARVEDTLDDDIRDQREASGLPLIDGVGERVVLLTAQEATRAEEAWVNHGEEWYKHMR